MALIRALWDAVYVEAQPDFKESPYELGSFDEIVYSGGRKAGGSESIGDGGWSSDGCRNPTIKGSSRTMDPTRSM